MKRLLFLKPGAYFFAHETPIKEKYRYLSEAYCGDIIAVVHVKQLRHFVLDKFVLRGVYLPRWIRDCSLLRDLCYAVFCLVFVLYVHYFRHRYDVIIAYDPIYTGVLGMIMGKLTGAKVIVEVNGNFKSAFLMNGKQPGLLAFLKHRYSSRVIPFVLSNADGVKLLYGGQTNSFRARRESMRDFVFANFVPIRHFNPLGQRGNYILFLGYPWFLKGVDILIKAFKDISLEFPDYSLKIVGHCPNRDFFERLALGNEAIMLCKAVWYEEVIRLMGECSVFVLPSRTDAMGRAMVEAMAARKPIIASNVDGIPEYIQHGYNGLLFESENIGDLAQKLRIVLNDKEYAEELARNGYNYATRHLSEEMYVRNFSRMIEEVVAREAC